MKSIFCQAMRLSQASRIVSHWTAVRVQKHCIGLEYGANLILIFFVCYHLAFQKTDTKKVSKIGFSTYNLNEQIV